jgi:hypothetical protein
VSGIDNKRMLLSWFLETFNFRGAKTVSKFLSSPFEMVFTASAKSKFDTRVPLSRAE